MFLSGGILATATVAGGFPRGCRSGLLIGPGLIMVGVGLLLTRGLNASSPGPTSSRE